MPPRSQLADSEQDVVSKATFGQRAPTEEEVLGMLSMLKGHTLAAGKKAVPCEGLHHQAVTSVARVHAYMRAHDDELAAPFLPTWTVHDAWPK